MLRSPDRLRVVLTGLMGLALLACAGCGDGRLKTVPVKVSVTLDGVPFGPGKIMFLPKGTEKQASGDIDAQGNVAPSSYGDGDGLTLGEFRVVVRPPMGVASPIPGIYADDAQTPMTVKVDSSTTNLKVDLVSSAGAPAAPSGGLNIQGSMSSEEMMRQSAPKTSN